MTPSPRRSIRNVSKVDRPASVPAKKFSEKPAPAPVPILSPKKKTSKGSGFSKTMLVLLVLVIALGIVAAALSVIFSSGTIIVKPKSVNVNLNKIALSAREKPLAGELGYQTLSLSDMATTSVPAVQGAVVEKRASGTIILYNNISTQSQKILANTRLSNTKGLIYLTTTTVTIPGQKIVAGKLVPGSIKVGVIASAPGSQYNASLIDLTGDFKVVAYQGGPKYTKVYGRLATDLTGGYSGKIVTPDAKATPIEISALKKSAEARLLVEARNLVPKDYILYDPAYRMSYEIIPPIAEGTNRAVIGVKSLYTGYIFKQDALVKSFARDALAQFPTGSSTFSGLETLSFSFATSTADKISFTLNGSMKIIGIVPVDAFIKDMTGIRLEDSAQIIKKYKTISSAYAKIFPMWMRSLPDKAERIKVEISSDSKE